MAPGEPVTFQTFSDRKRKPDPLAKWMHGTLAQHRQRLADLNARGAGIFWMVNAGNGKGRNTKSVQRIRALFVDLDGSPLEPVQRAPLQPHCIVATSPGKWHAYWRIADCPPSGFSDMQKALAERFGGDAKVCDLPRVMRLPGFMHCKGHPFPVALVALCDKPPYTLAELVRVFDLHAPETSKPAATVTPIRARKLPQEIPEGERNTTLFSLARGLVQKGFHAGAVNDRLQRINAERCKPPLGADEVDGIAAQAMAYGSDGFVMLPHKLLASQEWKALAPPAHDVIVAAFHRHNDANARNIALTWPDFQGLPGFGKKGTFYRHRNAAVQAGILLRVSEGGNTQTGRKPDLFAIAPKWVRHARQYPKGNLAPVPKRDTPT
jgi:hypothetical protein